MIETFSDTFSFVCLHHKLWPNPLPMEVVLVALWCLGCLALHTVSMHSHWAARPVLAAEVLKFIFQAGSVSKVFASKAWGPDSYSQGSWDARRTWGFLELAFSKKWKHLRKDNRTDSLTSIHMHSSVQVTQTYTCMDTCTCTYMHTLEGKKNKQKYTSCINLYSAGFSLGTTRWLSNLLLKYPWRINSCLPTD